MTHLGFTSLTSSFDLGVRKRVGGVEAVVLSISQSIPHQIIWSVTVMLNRPNTETRLTLFLSHIW